MTGMPCCCPETGCELTLEELPVPSITGMYLYQDWVLNGCCATAIFLYDEEQPLRIVDGGDTMTYDKTESYGRELFYFPKTCPTVTQATWQLTNGIIGDTNEAWTAVPGVEPPYINCCNDPVSVNTLTATFRRRGGQRFVASIRPIQISITIEKSIEYTCPPAGPVTKFFLKSTIIYEAKYDYIDYGQSTSNYTLADSNPACYNPPPDNTSVTTHSFPFDIDLWDGTTGSSIYVETCREKALTALPVVTTDCTCALKAFKSKTAAFCCAPNACCAFMRSIAC